MTGLDTVQLRFTKTALAAVLSRDYRGTGNGSKRLLGDQHSNQAGGKGDLNHCRGGGEECSDTNYILKLEPVEFSDVGLGLRENSGYRIELWFLT